MGEVPRAAFRPARRCDAGRPCQHKDLHHQHPAGEHRPHGAARPHLGGVEGRGDGGRHRLHPCRGQRHRHVHVREADAREPRQLRAHGRGAQHAVGGALVQPGDPPRRECRGRGALHGACLGGDRRGRARVVARARLPDVRRDAAPVPDVQRRGLQAAGRADVPHLPVAEISRGPEARCGRRPTAAPSRSSPPTSCAARSGSSCRAAASTTRPAAIRASSRGSG